MHLFEKYSQDLKILVVMTAGRCLIIGNDGGGSEEMVRAWAEFIRGWGSKPHGNRTMEKYLLVIEKTLLNDPVRLQYNSKCC